MFLYASRIQHLYLDLNSTDSPLTVFVLSLDFL